MKKFTHEVLSLLLLSLSVASFNAAAEGTLKVVTDATFPPLEFVKDGQMTGFDIELIKEVGKRLDKKVELVQVDFKGLIPSLVSGRADAAISGIYITEERAKVVDFSDTYLAGGLVVLTRQGNDAINSPADLAGKSVSAQIGTKSVAHLKEHFPQTKIVEVEKNQQMFNLVSIGRVDAAVTGKPAAFTYATERGGVKILPEQLTTEEYGIAVRKGAGDLKQQIDQAIEAMKQDGTYDELYQKWFPAT
ncbi:transporter substrate-binding domain-containing protein [Ectopseudomonas oleovorans]|uniref:Transporter substrate-binding domain-containing protein n=1 Tax=Ectopseudomonas oleovorans TaxID=301 RepID=A0AA42Q8K1_ECTOL|nr:transporter substrate-binding domain-containing protein [Pseudomonas oleovorans]MDH1339025.1 transporter substrate-binding domain-containing protein [Pseudomonas oleovorans]MDH1492011.1 transporter substrate-binding domain-containing protein [Pseudomonas oleovorans]WGG20926.1 transporter substrate-binding domain-containing protein [Pseudomonas oleovorans]